MLVRPLGTRLYRLHLKTNLKHPVTLDVNSRARVFPRSGHGKLRREPEPSSIAIKGQIRFSVPLPAGPAEWIWTWG